MNVLTVNLRFDTPHDGDYAWPYRRTAMRTLIEHSSADIVATQEGRKAQLDDLASLLPEYVLADAHREWIDERMYPCIFVRSDALEILASGDSWLSETPELAESKVAGSNYPRLVSWVHLRHRRGNESMIVANVHLDNAATDVRSRQIRIAARTISAYLESIPDPAARPPLVLCGDFNDAPGSEVAASLFASFAALVDPWRCSSLPEQTTVRGFPGDTKIDAPRIDWILLEDRLTWHAIRRMDLEPEGVPPTDHYPVLCEGIRSSRSVMEDMRERRPVVWRNPRRLPIAEVARDLPWQKAHLEAAHSRFDRLAVLLGHDIRSPLRRLPAGDAFGDGVEQGGRVKRGGEHSRRLFAKCDNELPVAGSVKARGGFYEVLLHAERVAAASGLDLSVAADRGRIADSGILSGRMVSVASTGNLGLSVGLAGRRLGFRVRVYMSRDAREWKKELLRSHGAEVVECTGDYSSAVLEAREAADATSASNDRDAAQAETYFVDDERSPHLFLGYACAAFEVVEQLRAEGVDPLSRGDSVALYLPCGVGGGPGGIAFGMKTLLGDAVRVFFVEPLEAPCFLLGLLSRDSAGSAAHSQAPSHTPPHVSSIGLDCRTEADGLAVGTASPLVLPIMDRLVEGIATLEDEQMLARSNWFDRELSMRVEPSAAASLAAVAAIADTAENHLVWLTGGGLLPDDEIGRIRKFGKSGTSPT